MVRPLPGIRFETVAPPLADALPRMDVAVFVGLAAPRVTSPLGSPASFDSAVAVEDPSEFSALFDELPESNLGPAVRGFFRNGGRRCWVVALASLDGLLDPQLADASVPDLLDEADYLRYQSPTPRPLEGIHAALSVDEATIVAVPDAVLAGWTSSTTYEPLPAPPPPDAAPPEAPPLFAPCDTPQIPLSSPPASEPAVEVPITTKSFSDGILVQVHRALLRMCAARGDLFAILSVPAHYRELDLLAHAAKLTTAKGGLVRYAPRRSQQEIGAFGPSETGALSYGALYHPWLAAREESAPDSLRTSPPDGAIAGTFAKRSLLRGAWIAPAGETLHGVVALDPPIRQDYWQALQDAQVNIIRQVPSGFVCLNADTLSFDDSLRPINVRRLLQLLRRAALKLGVDYVFEPNDASFRRSVQRGFEGLLGGMFVRGAFAGRIPSESFQVVTDSSLNTRASIDLGRFIVELKVAPSLPLTFLTVRLVQSGDRTYVTED